MSDSRALVRQLPALLLPWYAANRRELPWRQDREPYHVWLSEIMLQQTRVEAVRDYYVRFLQTLPTVSALAEAPEDVCHKLWEGLGYYSRVRNLQKAARQILQEFGGEFPRDYASIRRLSGVGDYTAGAIASICFEQRRAAVDGNVVRVMTRLLADSTSAENTAFRKKLAAMLEEVYPADSCGSFTQALMELGATVCLPRGNPRCQSCPLAGICRAHGEKNPEKYPVKPLKKPKKCEKITVFLLKNHDDLAILKRPDTGLLAGLWEYPNLPGHLSVKQALAQAEIWGMHPLSVEKVVEREHIFTHIRWEMRGIWLQVSARPERFVWASPQELEKAYALPTAFRQFTEI